MCDGLRTTYHQDLELEFVGIPVFVNLEAQWDVEGCDFGRRIDVSLWDYWFCGVDAEGDEFMFDPKFQAHFEEQIEHKLSDEIAERHRQGVL